MHVKPIRFLWALGFAGFGLFAATRVLEGRPERQPFVQSAPLLQRVQALGDLHAVRYTIKDVHEYQTSQEPGSMLAVMPGGEDLVHAFTKNSTLMSFDGAVEAGVDLTKAKVTRSAKGIDVLLPKPVVFAPNVSARVHDLHRGIVWRDIGITTSAIEDAKQRFREISLQQGILEDAKKSVRIRIASLTHDLASGPVTVSFQGDSV